MPFSLLSANPMTSAQFSKLKELFSYRANGGVLTDREGKDLRRLWDMAELETSGLIQAWVSKSKYYDEHPLATWGL
jgi:hypothetical protein